jgi:chromosomal replication initiation ATPase DnaA
MTPQIYPGIFLPAKKHTIEKLIFLVSEIFEVPAEVIITREKPEGSKGRRSAKPAQARFACMYIMHEIYGMSDSVIAKFFGMTRTSALHGRRDIAGKIEHYKDLKFKISMIKNTITPCSNQ